MSIFRSFAAFLLLMTTSGAMAAPPPPLDRTAWLIVSLDGKPTEQTPRLEFVRGQAIGTSGCNSFEGTYVRRLQTLAFQRIIATQKGCIGTLGLQEKLIFKLLGPNVRMRYDTSGNFYLFGGTHSAVLRRAPKCFQCDVVPPALPLPQLAGNTWVILSINGKPVQQRAAAQIQFSANRFSATVGCNGITGPYRIGKTEYIVTGQIISTLIGCPTKLADEERALSKLLADDPWMQRVSKARESVRIRLSSGQNEAVIAQQWYIGLD